MNPCTIMGGFWFEFGRCVFGLAVAGALFAVILVAAVIKVFVIDRRRYSAQREVSK